MLASVGVVTADNLGEGTPPEVLRNCAEFFMQHKQYDKAVHLLVEGKKVAEVGSLTHSHSPSLSHTLPHSCFLHRYTHRHIARVLGTCGHCVDEVFIRGPSLAALPQAIDMATTYKVKITDDMAEKLTPPKVDEADEAANKVLSRNHMHALITILPTYMLQHSTACRPPIWLMQVRNELLGKLANLCKKQGSFHLATKKYTQVRADVGVILSV